MKKIILLLTVYLLMGCANDNATSPKSVAKVKGKTVFVSVIDGCEYLVTAGYGWSVHLTHKGNCNNPIHIYGGRE